MAIEVVSAPQSIEPEDGTAEDRLEKVFYLRDKTRKMLHDADRQMRFQRIVALGVQMTQIVFLTSIPFFLYFVPDLAILQAAVSALALLSLVGAAYQVAFNPQGRWVHYLQLRLEAQKRLLDLDLSVHSAPRMNEIEYTKIVEGLTKVLHQQQSLWSIGELLPTDVEETNEVRR